MADRVLLDIKLERKGSVRNVTLRIARTDIPLTEDRAQVRARAATTYFLYLMFEGRTGSSVQLSIVDPSGGDLLKITHQEMMIPPLLGRNGGSFEFKVP